MLEQERTLYDASIAVWAAQHPGKFVVVKLEDVVGFFDTIDEALAAGASKFGLQSFLVRRIGEQDAITVPALTLGILR
jgi:hypothetical protein